MFLKRELMKFSAPYFFSPENIYTFRNGEYIKINLVKRFIVEYVDDLIGDDKQYCDMVEINKHIHKIFEN